MRSNTKDHLPKYLLQIATAIACLYTVSLAGAKTITSKRVGFSFECPDGWECNMNDMKENAMKRRQTAFTNPNDVPDDPIPLSADKL